MGVNQSRSGLNRNVNDATDDAKLIGFNDDGEACVWHGGYSFNVYDAARDWHETRAFTSGKMAGDLSAIEMEMAARDRMKSEGFQPIEP